MPRKTMLLGLGHLEGQCNLGNRKEKKKGYLWTGCSVTHGGKRGAPVRLWGEPGDGQGHGGRSNDRQGGFSQGIQHLLLDP